MKRRMPVWALLVILAYAGGLATLLLWPTGTQVRRINLDIYLFGYQKLGLPLWITPEWYAAAGNVLAPALLSAAITALDRRSRWWLWGGGIAVACLLAEVGQALYLPGRDPEFSDVALNTAGALLGAASVAMARRRRAQAGPAPTP